MSKHYWRTVGCQLSSQNQILNDGRTFFRLEQHSFQGGLVSVCKLQLLQLFWRDRSPNCQKVRWEQRSSNVLKAFGQKQIKRFCKTTMIWILCFSVCSKSHASSFSTHLFAKQTPQKTKIIIFRRQQSFGYTASEMFSDLRARYKKGFSWLTLC